jgi:hypothetical protein
VAGGGPESGMGSSRVLATQESGFSAMDASEWDEAGVTTSSSPLSPATLLEGPINSRLPTTPDPLLPTQTLAWSSSACCHLSTNSKIILLSLLALVALVAVLARRTTPQHRPHTIRRPEHLSAIIIFKQVLPTMNTNHQKPG